MTSKESKDFIGEETEKKAISVLLEHGGLKRVIGVHNDVEQVWSRSGIPAEFQDQLKHSYVLFQARDGVWVGVEHANVGDYNGGGPRRTRDVLEACGVDENESLQISSSWDVDYKF